MAVFFLRKTNLLSQDSEFLMNRQSPALSWITTNEEDIKETHGITYDDFRVLLKPRVFYWNVSTYVYIWQEIILKKNTK